MRFVEFHLRFDNINKSNKKPQTVPILKNYFVFN